MEKINKSEVRDFLEQNPGFKQKNRSLGKDRISRTYLIKKYNKNERLSRFFIGLLKVLVTFGIWAKSEKTREQLKFSKKSVILVLPDESKKSDFDPNEIKTTQIETKKTEQQVKENKTDQHEKENKKEHSVKENENKKSEVKVPKDLKEDFRKAAVLDVKKIAEKKAVKGPIVIDVENNVITGPDQLYIKCEEEELKKFLETYDIKELTLLLPRLKIHNFEKKIDILIEKRIPIKIRFNELSEHKDFCAEYTLKMIGVENRLAFYQLLNPDSQQSFLQALADRKYFGEEINAFFRQLPAQGLKYLINILLENQKSILSLLDAIEPINYNSILEIIQNSQNSSQILSDLITEALSQQRRHFSLILAESLDYKADLKSNSEKFIQFLLFSLSESALKKIINSEKENPSNAEFLYKLLSYVQKESVNSTFLRIEFFTALAREKSFHTHQILFKGLSDKEWEILISKIFREEPESIKGLILFLEKTAYSKHINELFKQDTEQLLQFFIKNRSQFPKDFLKKCYKFSKEKNGETHPLTKELDDQICQLVAEKLENRFALLAFSPETQEIDFDRLNIYLKFPISRRKWTEALKYFKDIKEVILPREPFIPNSDPHKIGTLRALEILMDKSENKPPIICKRMFSQEEWNLLLEKRETKNIWDHLSFDSLASYNLEIDQIPFFISQWIKIGPFKAGNIERCLEKGLEKNDFLEKLASILDEEEFKKLFKLIINKDSWHWLDMNWFYQKVFSHLNNSQIIMFYELIEGGHLQTFLMHDSVPLYGHFKVLSQAEDKAQLEKFVKTLAQGHSLESILKSCSSDERKIILHYLTLHSIYQYSRSGFYGDYFKIDEIREETHQRLEDISVEDVASYREFFTDEDLISKADKLLESLQIDETDPESFKVAFKNLALARQIAPMRFLMDPVNEYVVNYIRNQNFVRSTDHKIADLIALDAFFIALNHNYCKNDGLEGQLHTLMWIMQLSYKNTDWRLGELLGKGLALLTSSDDISMNSLALIKQPGAAIGFMQGLLNENDPSRVQLAFRTFLQMPETYEVREGSGSIISSVLGSINTPEKLRWVVSVVPETMQELFMKSAGHLPFSKETVIEILNAPKELHLSPTPAGAEKIEIGLEQLRQRLAEANNIDEKHYSNFSYKWSKELENLKKELHTIYKQDLMNLTYKKIVEDFDSLDNEKRDLSNKINLKVYTRRIEKIERRLSALKDLDQNLENLFSQLRVLKRKVQRIPESSRYPEIAKIIERAKLQENEIDTLLLQSCAEFIEKIEKKMSDVNMKILLNKVGIDRREFYRKIFEELAPLSNLAAEVSNYLSCFQAEKYIEMGKNLRGLFNQIKNHLESLRKFCGIETEESSSTDTKILNINKFLLDEKFDLKQIKSEVPSDHHFAKLIEKVELCKNHDTPKNIAALFQLSDLPSDANDFKKALKITIREVHPDKNPDIPAALQIVQLIKGIGDHVLKVHYKIDRKLPHDPTWKNK